MTGQEIAELMERDAITQRLERIEVFLEQYALPCPAPVQRVKRGRR